MTVRYTALASKMLSGKLAILDGGTSTELDRRGASMDGMTWSACASIQAFDLLVETHQAYIDAGADIITVNGYASSRLVLEPAGLSDQIDTINKKNIEAALLARDRSGNPDVLVAGSVSHSLGFRSGVNKSIERDVSPNQFSEAFDEMFLFYEEGEVDLVLLEMMSLPIRMMPLFERASQSPLPIWCGLSARRKDQASEITGHHDGSILLIDNIHEASKHQFEGMGIMHTSVELIEEGIDLIKAAHDGLITAYPDSGCFKPPNWDFEEVISPADLVTFAAQWKTSGANVIGGCCGLDPSHIEALAKLS